jgi:protein-tyrosine phosphatase
VSLPRFVDVHSHVVPSGDDGVETVEEGRDLCRAAAEHGTRLLFATPHVWPQLTLTDRREEEVKSAFAVVAARAELELRLGFELTPTATLLREDLLRYRLEGTDAVLMEVPFVGPADLLFRLAERAQTSGLTPVIAHPERAEAVLADPKLAVEFSDRGWLVQVNSTSLLGRHGWESETLGWDLLDAGHAALVASDGHRAARPPELDEAFAAVGAQLGEDRALALFDGSALGLASERLPSRAVSRDA